MKKLAILLTVLFLNLSTIVPLATAENSTIYQTEADQIQAWSDQKADSIINTAMSLIGKATYNRYIYKPTYPYEFGCSGFIMYVFLQNGIDLNTRDTQFQAILGEYLPKDQLRKGDLVFFDSNPNDSSPVTHDGIYIGDNKIIHMADSISNVKISDLSGSYYTKYYRMARRVIPGYMPPINPTPGDKVALTAENLMDKVNFGYPYDETSLTFNSPGFAYYVYKQNGLNLYTKLVSGQANLGVYVSKDQLKRGDLVFFSSDTSDGKPVLVGIYAGNFNVILNAGTSLGVVKRFMLNSWYNNHYVTARRIL